MQLASPVTHLPRPVTKVWTFPQNWFPSIHALPHKYRFKEFISPKIECDAKKRSRLTFTPHLRPKIFPRIILGQQYKISIKELVYWKLYPTNVGYTWDQVEYEKGLMYDMWPNGIYKREHITLLTIVLHPFNFPTENPGFVKIWKCSTQQLTESFLFSI